jgi:hypothetical protein
MSDVLLSSGMRCDGLGCGRAEGQTVALCNEIDMILDWDDGVSIC